MRIRYYTDDRTGALVRFVPPREETYVLAVGATRWVELRPDNSYMREIMLGQGNNVLDEISAETALELINIRYFGLEER